MLAVQGERNFHLFYHMLSGASQEERKLLQLLPLRNDYTYLAGDTPKAPGIDDAAEWTAVHERCRMIQPSPLLSFHYHA